MDAVDQIENQLDDGYRKHSACWGMPSSRHYITRVLQLLAKLGTSNKTCHERARVSYFLPSQKSGTPSGLPGAFADHERKQVDDNYGTNILLGEFLATAILQYLSPGKNADQTAVVTTP